MGAEVLQARFTIRRCTSTASAPPTHMWRAAAAETRARLLTAARRSGRRCLPKTRRTRGRRRLRTTSSCSSSKHYGAPLACSMTGRLAYMPTTTRMRDGRFQLVMDLGHAPTGQRRIRMRNTRSVAHSGSGVPSHMARKSSCTIHNTSGQLSAEIYAQKLVPGRRFVHSSIAGPSVASPRLMLPITTCPSRSRLCRRLGCLNSSTRPSGTQHRCQQRLAVPEMPSWRGWWIVMPVLLRWPRPWMMPRSGATPVLTGIRARSTTAARPWQLTAS
mmetsp:Transcript_15472/g.28447  ORF Transcript_15472/g.28447 Transcript_15472/m.28447 type:complete len:273 (+) Transcript_15472:669-1487(+)